MTNKARLILKVRLRGNSWKTTNESNRIICTCGSIFSSHCRNESESFSNFQFFLHTCLCVLVMSLWRGIWPIIVKRPHWLKHRPFRFKAKWQLLIVGKLITLQSLSLCIKQGASRFPYSDCLAQRIHLYRHVNVVHFMIADKSLFI